MMPITYIHAYTNNESPYAILTRTFFYSLILLTYFKDKMTVRWEGWPEFWPDKN